MLTSKGRLAYVNPLSTLVDPKTKRKISWGTAPSTTLSWSTSPPISSPSIGPTIPGWVRGSKTSAEVGETACERWLAVVSSPYGKSHEESPSHNYTFRVIYTSSDRVNVIECYYPDWQCHGRRWQGLNSACPPCAEHKGWAIALFTVSTAAPWAGPGGGDWQPYRDGHFDNLNQEPLKELPS